MFYALPEELIWIILSFAGMDKKSNMDRVLDQFIKGGFNRKNLKIQPYLSRQHWCAKQFWLSTRPELWMVMTEWNPITLKREVCPFEYMNGEWSIKWKMVRVTFTKSSWVDGHLVQKFRQKQSSKNPVSKWLQNIEKFETAHPTYATYLPERKNRFNIKCISKFYKERSEKRKKKLARSLKFQQNKKKAQDLSTEVFNIKLESAKKQYGFEVGQEILIPCLPEQVVEDGYNKKGSVWCNPLSGQCLQEGKIAGIKVWQKLKDYGTNPVPRFLPAWRHRMKELRYNKFCRESIDKAFQVQITIRVSGSGWSGFFAHYTPDVLFARLQESEQFLKNK